MRGYSDGGFKNLFRQSVSKSHAEFGLSDPYDFGFARVHTVAGRTEGDLERCSLSSALARPAQSNSTGADVQDVGHVDMGLVLKQNCGANIGSGV